MRLINTDHVAPPAAATNDNGDFSRNQFLQGGWRCSSPAPTTWRRSPKEPGSGGASRCCPKGPKGRVSVTNGIAAAGNSATRHPDAVREVLAWMGSTRGNEFLGASGAAIPAVLGRAACLRQVLAITRRRRQPVLQRARRPAHRRTRRCRIRGGISTRSSRTSTRCSSAAAMCRRSLADAQRAANTAAQR